MDEVISLSSAVSERMTEPSKIHDIIPYNVASGVGFQRDVKDFNEPPLITSPGKMEISAFGFLQSRQI